MELQVLVHVVNMGENIAHNSGDDSLQVIVSQHPFHCMCFSRRGLTIGKDGSIEPTEHI